MTSPAAPSSLADELATSHIRLVQHIVRETMSRVPQHVDREDLNSAGLMALVQASRAFDPERGLTFASYASRRIRGAILDELRNIDWAARSVRRLARDISTTRQQLASELGVVPDDERVARQLGIALAEIQRCDGDVARAQVLSLQGSTTTSYDDLLPSSAPTPEQALEHNERLQYLGEAIEELPERLRLVVREYFLAERPMAEIAETLGVSESRVSQIRAEALVLLRDALNSALDPSLVSAPTNPEGCVTRRRTAYFAAVAERHAASRMVGFVGAIDATA